MMYDQVTIPSRIAIVEDQPDTRSALADSINACSATTRIVFQTGDEQSAKDNLAKGEAHIVAVDLYLQDEEPGELLEPDRPAGLRLCEFLKSQRWETKIVLYSGHATSMLLSNCWLADADSYFPKDFTREPAAQEIERLANGNDPSPWRYPDRTDLRLMQELIDHKSLLSSYQRRVYDMTVRGFDSRTIQRRLNLNAESPSEQKTLAGIRGAQRAISEKLPRGWKTILER